MLEKIIYDYLNTDGVLSVPAYLERPKKPPKKFVLVERTAGNGDETLMQGTFAVQSIAQRLSEAIALNEEVIEAMRQIQELDELCSVRLVNFYNFTNRTAADPEEHRYQAIFEIVHY